MKKLLALMLCAMLVMCSFAALAEDAYADLGSFTMIVGHAQPEGNPRWVSMEKFAADVAERTNGHVTVQVYGNGQL
jgi:TRAP-type C4-dicarboxylate transport system substrate-binding protein